MRWGVVAAYPSPANSHVLETRRGHEGRASLGVHIGRLLELRSLSAIQRDFHFDQVFLRLE